MKEYSEKSLIIAVLGIFVLIALAVPATAAEGINVTEQWNMTFGGAGDDYGYSVQQTADGGYILAGDTRSYGAGNADIWLIKTDSKGNEQWNRTFGGAEADLLDRGSVRQTSDGGYVITGYTYSYGAGDADVWLIKTDPGGTEQWNRTFGGEGLDWGHSVRQTSDGGYVIAGRIIPPYAGARADAWLIKTDSNGVEEWNRIFGADGCEYAASVQQTADGGYIMTGRTTSFGAAEADAWLIRTDSNGIEQWNRTFGGATYDYGYSVQQTSDGGYVIAGSTNGRQDVWLIKTDSNGTEEWNTIFGGPANDEGYSVQQTSDGGYIIAGYTQSYGTAGSADVWLIRTDSNGIEQWNMTVGGTGLEKGYSVHQTADGDYIAAGYTNSFGAGGYDMWLIKLSTPIVRQIDLLTSALETPPTPYANLTNTISATIKNNGMGDASSLFNVSLSADGSPVDKTEVSELDAGESVVVNLYWTPSSTGDFELCVIADCDFEVNESNEGNNVLCENVTVFSFEHSCWNDTFDDETKIAEEVNVVVCGGDVELNNTTHGQGSITSVGIQPSSSYFKNWAVFNANDTEPAGTNIAYKILDASSSTIMDVVEGQDISGITQQSIRLFAELNTTNDSLTPVLYDWGVCWATGEVDLLPIAIETPPKLYSNLSFPIDVEIANDGDAHSGGFNVVLYADDIGVDTAFINDIPAGENTTITFEWTPDHVGDYNLTAIADSEGVIHESDEANNNRTKEATVLPTNVRRVTFDQNSSINPNVVTDSEGNMHVVWQDYRSSTDPNWPNWEIFYKKLDANGSVLVNDTRLTNTSGFCYYSEKRYTFGASIEPAVVVDSTGNVYVAWEEQVLSCYNPAFHVYFTKLDDSGNVLIAPRSLTPTSMEGFMIESSVLGGIAVDPADVIHVLWEQYTTRYSPKVNVHKMYYGQFDSDGNPIGDPIYIGGLSTKGYGSFGGVRGDRYIASSTFALDSSSNAHIVYSAQYKGVTCTSGGWGKPCHYDPECPYPDCVQEIYYRKIDSGGTVHDVIRLTDDNRTFASFTPDACVDDDGNVHVVWVNNEVMYDPEYQHELPECQPEPGGYFDNHSHDLYYMKLDNTGDTLIEGKRMTFDCSPEPIAKPSIDTESGIIYIVWSEQPANREVYYMTLGTSGGTLTNKTLISLDDGFDSSEPDIAACSDGAYLVWTDNRDGNNEIYYAKTTPPRNRFFLLCPPGKWTPMNVNATYAIGVMSTMNNTETFDLTLDNLDGASVAELSTYTITVDPDSTGEVILNATDAVIGDYRVKVSVESQSNPAINASAIITTSVILATPDLIITAIDAYHNNTAESLWFNLSNEVDVTVKNTGTASAGAFNVSLYADAEYVDKKRVTDLGVGAGGSTTVQFKWTPVGADCFKDCSFTDTSRDYNLTVVADCDNEVNESDETNNNLTEVERACYNGYMADEPLENAAHGLLHGGLLFTTGDGTYGGLYNLGDYKNTTYEITLPAGASVVLARLNVYYTWHYEKESCPQMEMSITNETGTYILSLEKSYNDIKCYGAAWVFPWGNYVYNLTPHIQSSGTYTVTVKRTGGPSFCIAAPGIEVLYKDEIKPLIEYWINEGADVLIGGRRSDGGHLSLAECINNATFPGNIDLSRVKNATLGVVSPWAGAAWTPGMTNYLFFNDIVLGQGAYHDETYEETIGSISMHIGSTNAQVGVNLSDVTDYLRASDNRVGQGDDGDCMMPCNAFLVVEYELPTAFKVYGWVNDSTGAPVLNPNVTITNLNTAEVFIAETNASSNYYQVVTSSEYVSAGNVLHFYASDNGNKTEFNHVVTQEEIDAGVLEQNITIVPDTTPPASITNLHNTTYAPTYINWSWTNPADADFSHTMVYINGTWEKNTSAPFYNATGLNPDTAYEIGTRTVDRAGNVNQAWVNHSARTAPAAPAGICGDVTGDGKVRMSDGRQIYLNQTYPGMYPLDEWAADVTGDGKVRMSDGRQIYLNQTYPGMYTLECC